ncbi:MAG: alpha/beta hydrolase, partial [Planctomycetota bacterium JB042]
MQRAPALALATLLALAGSAFPASSYDLVEDLPYSTAHPDLLFDWYRPAGPGPHPAAVFVHGAFLAGGGKADVRTAEPNVLLLDMLLAHGVTVFSIDVRPFPEFIHPAQLEDAGVAIQFLRHHAAQHAIDPNRLAVWGQSGGAVICGWLSYGADLAAASGTPQSQVSTRPQAFVNSVGLSDWQLLHPGLPGWMFGKATLGEVDAGLLKAASFAQNVLDVPRTSTPPVASLFPGPVGTPPLLDVHDTLMMKVLHANLASGFPAVAAQSRELTRVEHPTEGTRQELVAEWLLDLFGLPSDV